MYHDASAVLMSDVPTPIKYYNDQITQDYKNIKKIAQQKLIDIIPEILHEEFCQLIDEQYYLPE